MMTIEELIEEHNPYPKKGYGSGSYDDWKDGFIEGLSVQKEIDDAEWTERCNRVHNGVIKKALAEKKVDKANLINKVCQWMEKNLPNTTMEDIINGVPTNCNRDAIIEKFRKDFNEEN